MVPKLITIDLDGTLLRNDCTIAPTVRKAILTCLNTSKTFFVPCTGRSYQNSRFVLGDFPAFPYYINANGTTVTEGSSGTLLHASTLPLETGCAVYSLAREYKTFIEIYHGLTAYDGAAGRQNLKESSCSKDYISQLLYTNTHLESLDDFVFDKKHPISKFHIVCVSQREKQELKQRLSRIPGVFPISTAYARFFIFLLKKQRPSETAKMITKCYSGQAAVSPWEMLRLKLKKRRIISPEATKKKGLYRP